MFQRAPDLSRNGLGPGRGRSTRTGKGRLVDRGIKIQALGRGARVQSLAETAQSPRTDSALAHEWAAKWIASPSGLHIDRVVLLVNAGHRMCCRRYGHDHRPAMITKAHKPVILAHRLGTFLGIQGLRSGPGCRPLAGRSKIICSCSPLLLQAHAAARRMGRSP